MLHEMSVDDRNASFADCYGLYEGTCVYICSFDYDNIARIQYPNGEEEEVDCFDLDLTEPEYGMVRLGNTLFYLAKHAVRQWRRGVKPSLLTAYILDVKGSVASSVPNEIKHEVMKVCVEKTLRGEGVINRDFGIAHGLLYFRTLPIGEVEGNVIKLHTNCFIPNLTGYKLEVAV